MDIGHIGVAEPDEQPYTRRPLIIAMLQHEPATGYEMRPRGGCDSPDAVHAIPASAQRSLRLESYVALRQMRVPI